MGVLYRFEVKGIQDFILSTNKLKEIKGGSRLVKLLAVLFEDTLLGTLGEQSYQVLTNAAGGATVRVDEVGQARQLMEMWPLLVHHFAPTLQVIQAMVPWDEEAAMPYETLQAQLQCARNQLWASLPESPPIAYRSPSTGLVAERLISAHGESTRVDSGTDHRLQLGTDSRTDELGDSIDPSITWAVNLEKDMPHGRIAVIHIDGNDLGQRLQALANQSQGVAFSEKLSIFSETLSRVTQRAASEAFAKVRDLALEKEIWEGGHTAFPARFIVIGGDDVTLLIDARLGHRYVEQYLKSFEQLCQDEAKALGGPLFACAGLVEVKSSWPFSQACQLAESLCSFSKSNLRGRIDGQTPSAFAWHRVTTSMVGDFEREVLVRELAGADGISLSAGPYTLRPVEGLMSFSQLRELADGMNSPHLPSGSLRQCLSYLKSDLRLAEDRWKRLAEISESSAKKARQEAWGMIKGAMSAMKIGHESLTTEEHIRGRVTPLADAFNLNKAEGKR